MTEQPVTVSVDGSHRVVGVRVHSVEPVRTTSALADAVAAAYRTALAGDDPPPRTMPVARRIRRISAAPRPELLERHQVRYRQPVPARSNASATGYSANGCVLVDLAPSGPRGTVSADAGWLAQTTADRLAAAVTEAYHDAYARRDQP